MFLLYVTIYQIYTNGGVNSFADSTGIKARRRSPAGVTASDLCYTAAEKLIAEMGWEKSDIGALVFVSQTPDYILPATSCASIPLALVTREREKLQTQNLRHIACGFGVGLSWGSVYFETGKIAVPELIEI